jgi:hypothetical protein
LPKNRDCAQNPREKAKGKRKLAQSPDYNNNPGNHDSWQLRRKAEAFGNALKERRVTHLAQELKTLHRHPYSVRAQGMSL